MSLYVVDEVCIMNVPIISFCVHFEQTFRKVMSLCSSCNLGPVGLESVDFYT